ncbi:unnamed protein product [Symbiodinium sp. CCMP2592]|nr:unnamed protein product [Symbiodinium sp. CCMP2592]
MASGGAGDGGGTVRVRREVFTSALRRLDAQLAQARQNAEAISERSREYRELRGVLAELPDKVSHPVMVPFGPMASFPGQLVHTNEVLCQLSSEYFALRTTGNALKMVDRRLRRLQDEQTSADRELQELSLRRRLAGGESEAESANSGSGPAGSSIRVDENGFLDIREPLEPEPALPKESSGAESAEEDAWKFWQNPAARDRGSDSTLSRLRELEQMEEGSDGPAEAPGDSYEDELSELDRIVESYADAEAKAGEPMNFDLLPKGAPKAQAPSPADLFRLMESSERRSKSYPSPGAPEATGARGAQGAQGALEHLGVSETVREHSQVESAASSQGHVALSLEAGYRPSFQAYKSVIQAFLNEKNMDAAQLWLQWMKGNGTTPDESIYLEFIRTSPRKVGQWLEKMEEEGVSASAESYNAAIRYFASLRSGKGALAARSWFDRMLEAGISATEETYTQMIAAYAGANHTDEAGQWLSKLAATGIRPHMSAYSALMQGYARAKDPAGVRQILDWAVLEGLTPNAGSYNIAIRAFAEAGDAASAEEMYKRLTVAGRYPNEKTFLFLIQCHARRLDFDRARAWFKEMLSMDVKQPAQWSMAHLPYLCRNDSGSGRRRAR